MKKFFVLIKEVLFIKEILAFVYNYFTLKNYLFDSDKHTIIVYPGFLTNNFSTLMLRKFLERFGHNVYGWEGGFNLGYCQDIDQILEDQLLKIVEKENKKVVLIGWSLGGIYARELARKYPKKVSKVIAIGSPFDNILEGTNIHWLYKLVAGRKIADLEPDLLAKIRKPLPLPFLSIYSRQDGVVDFRACIQKGVSACPYFNLEVQGTHLGLPFNLDVCKLVAHSLAGTTVIKREISVIQKIKTA